MPIRSLKDATIYISDVDGRRGANTLTVDVEEGNLSWTERYPVHIHNDRGVLSHARKANRDAAEVSFGMMFQSFSTHAVTTPYDAVTQTGGAASWVSAAHVADAYGVDVEVSIADPAGGSAEALNFNPCIINERVFNEGDPFNTLTFSGVSPIVSPLGTSITNNIVSYYRLGETSGTRYDSSFNAYDLTDNATVTRNASGRIGGAAEFAAANSEYLSRADESGIQFGDIDYSGCCWIYITDVTANRGIIGKCGTAEANQEWCVYFDTTNDHLTFIHITDGVGGEAIVSTANNSVSVNTWHFVRWRHDESADTVEIGIDDVPMVSAATGGGGNTGASQLRIGHIQDGDWYMEGRIDEVLLVKEKLTDKQFDYLYNRGYGRSWPLAS